MAVAASQGQQQQQQQQPQSRTPRQHSSSHEQQLAALSPYSIHSCQASATATWRHDLQGLFANAAKRFPDVSWTTTQDDQEDGEGSPSAVVAAAEGEDRIWAHKAIIYARAPNSFSTKYLNLRTPAANLGALASQSTVSLPSVRYHGSSHDLTDDASTRWRRGIRGAAPPTSFSLRKAFHNGMMTSDSEGESDAGSRPSSRNSIRSKGISRPFFRNGNGSYALSSAEVEPARDSDTYSLSTASVISTTSTIRPVQSLSLTGINQAFFHATLEYLYTAEESMVDAFDFLFEDRAPQEVGVDERLAKLRDDFTFMWRSKLFADIKITLGDDAHVPSIPDPDPTMSVASLPMEEDPEDEATSFASHRMILVSRSPYFAAQLLSPYADASATVAHLPTPPFTPAALHFTLGFLYTGTLTFSNRTFDLTTALQLWRCGAYLQVDTLQSLVSAHITYDFCHAFTCSPPCKKCCKRVPRVLTFATSPDVGDTHLAAAARAVVSGPSFGSFWAKEVGNMDYAVRGSLVSDVCARLNAHPPAAIPILRQLSIVCARVDSERALPWVGSLRWMCDSVEAALKEVVEANFEAVVASPEWTDLVDGVGFMTDVLRKFLRTLVDGLNERRAARVYQILVGQVLLREESQPTGETKEALEEARSAIIVYLRRRWTGVRTVAGFNDLENWCLKELSDELEVPVDDLLLADTSAVSEPLLTRTGLKVTAPRTTAPATGGVRAATRTSGAASRPAVQEGEREAGPINMRASVLNRNAARTSISSGRINVASAQPDSTTTPRQASQPAHVEGDISSRRSSSASTSSAAAWRAAQAERAAAAAAATRQTAAPSNPRRAPSVTSVRSTAAISSTAPASSRSQAARPSASTAQGRMAGPSRSRTTSASTTASRDTMDTSGGEKTPTASLLSVRDNGIGVRSPSPGAPRTPARSLRSARSDASLRSSASATPMRPSTVLADNRPSPSASEQGTPKPRAFLRATPKPEPSPRSRRISGMSTAAAQKQRVDPAAPAEASRSIHKTGSSANVRTQQPKAESGAKRKQPETSTGTAPGVKAMARALEVVQPAVGKPSQEPPPPSIAISDAMDVDVEAVPDVQPKAPAGPDAASRGTSLSLGVPCIVAPRVPGAPKALRFRGAVKYIGPLAGQVGQWVGIEVALPLPDGLQAVHGALQLGDGTYRGERYFELGAVPPHQDGGAPHGTRDGDVDFAKPEREARRRRVARLVGRHGASGSIGGSVGESMAGSTPTSPTTTTEYDDAVSSSQPDAKRSRLHTSTAQRRRKSETITGPTKGLFVRPKDVLWVVAPE